MMLRTSGKTSGRDGGGLIFRKLSKEKGTSQKGMIRSETFGAIGRECLFYVP